MKTKILASIRITDRIIIPIGIFQTTNQAEKFIINNSTDILKYLGYYNEFARSIEYLNLPEKPESLDDLKELKEQYCKFIPI